MNYFRNLEVLSILEILGCLLIAIVIAMLLISIFKKEDEVICLGGHYIYVYNHQLKQSLPQFICDSAKIIYK